jgi:hypothetical protein
MATVMAPGSEQRLRMRAVSSTNQKECLIQFIKKYKIISGNCNGAWQALNNFKK